MQVTKHAAEAMETHCSTADKSSLFSSASSAALYKRQTYVNMHFNPTVLFVLLPTIVCFPRFDERAIYGILGPWLAGVVLTSISLQYGVVAHFHPYMDSTEQSWSFAEIGTMIALAGPFYEIFRVGRELRTGQRDQERFFESKYFSPCLLIDLGLGNTCLGGAWIVGLVLGIINISLRGSPLAY